MSTAVSTGGNVTLRCAGSFDTAWWFRGDITALKSVDTRPGVVELEDQALKIMGFHASDHAGCYYCLAVFSTLDAIHSCPAHISHASE